MKRLLFGGTFDPLHSGHLCVARAAARALGAERVSLVPAADAPHKRGAAAASAQDRLEMCRRAVRGDPLFDVLDVEVLRGGVSYTIDTVRTLREGACRGDSLMLLLGQDAFADFASWREARTLAETTPIVVVPRRGGKPVPWPELERVLGRTTADAIRARVLPLAPVDASSSAVRARVAEGKSIRCWVPDPVADYVEEHGLYR